MEVEEMNRWFLIHTSLVTVLLNLVLFSSLQADASRYRVITQPMSWHDAKRYAEHLGAHLVTIGSKAENDLVANLARDNGIRRYFWIGLTDELHEGRFRWVTGEPLTYTNWYSGEPNDSDNNEDYAGIGWHSKYSWNDGYSGQEKDSWNPFVIEFSDQKRCLDIILGVPRGVCHTIGSLYSNGKGDRHSKGVGGNSLRIKFSKLRKYYYDNERMKKSVESWHGASLNISQTKGTIKYISLHARTTKGVWRVIYKGKGTSFQLKKFKKFWSNSNYTDIIISINGASEKFEPIVAKADVKVCISARKSILLGIPPCRKRDLKIKN
jgi:hypothetical protein